MRFTQHDTPDIHVTSFHVFKVLSTKESFLYQFVQICWMGKAPVLYRSAAHQQCQWRKKDVAGKLGLPPLALSCTGSFFFWPAVIENGDSHPPVFPKLFFMFLQAWECLNPKIWKIYDMPCPNIGNFRQKPLWKCSLFCCSSFFCFKSYRSN